jgi:hypothetical protein
MNKSSSRARVFLLEPSTVGAPRNSRPTDVPSAFPCKLFFFERDFRRSVFESRKLSRTAPPCGREARDASSNFGGREEAARHRAFVSALGTTDGGAPLLTALRREGRHAAERTLARDSHVADARPYAGEPARVRPRAVSPLRADVSSRRSVVEPTGSAPCPRAHRRLTLPSPRPQWLEPRYNTRTMCSPEEARGSSARSSSRTTDVRPRARPRSPSSRSRTLSISATKRWWPSTVSFPDAPLSTLPTLATRADVVDDARVRLSRDPRTTQKADAFPAHPHALPSRPSPSRSRRGQSHPVPAPVGVRDLPHARRAARGVHGHGG